MIKRVCSVFFTLIILFFMLTGCGQQQIPSDSSINQNLTLTPAPEDSVNSPLPDVPDESVDTITPIETPESQIEQIVTPEVFLALSSPGLKGRKMGSSGGEQAQDILSDLFLEMNLLPYHGAYKNALFTNQFQGVASSISMNLDGFIKHSLVASEDYLVAPGRAFKGDYRVVYKAPAPEGEKVILIVDDGNESQIAGKYDQEAGYIYLKSPLFRSVVRGPTSGLYLFMKDEIIRQLKQYDGMAILSLDIPEVNNTEIVEGDNVISYLPGKNNKECLVLSAHFDGDDNETAALDNAAGVYAMLKTAEKLSNYSPSRDIIFAAFDGEEQGLIGSGYLSDEIKDRYDKIVVINFDCVGIKESDSYMIIGNEIQCSKLMDSLNHQLEAYSFNMVPVSGFFASDHLPFEWQGIPAVTIGERDVDGIVHTEHDVAEVVDTDEIDRLSEAVSQYVIESADELYK